MSEAVKLERHHNCYEMRAIKSFDYKGFKIAIAQGGPKFVYTKEVTRKNCPNGYYDVIWTVLQNEKALIESPLYFDTLHNIHDGWTNSKREQARILTAQNDAIDFIDKYLRSNRA